MQIQPAIAPYTHLDACEFFLSFIEPREFVERVESFRASESASWTLLRINDKGLIATLLSEGWYQYGRRLLFSFVQEEQLLFTHPAHPLNHRQNLLPVRFLFRRPLRPVRSVVLVMGVRRPVYNYRGHRNAGATGRSERGHGHDIVNVGGSIARVLVPIRVDVDRGWAGGIPFGWGRYVGHHTGKGNTNGTA